MAYIMDFVTPKDLALKFGTSLKTIYNYLSKSNGKIRIKKEFGKTFVNLSDFEKHYSKEVQNIQIFSHDNKESSINNTVGNNGKDFEKLQNDYNTLSEQKKNTDNYNLALQEQVSKYALLFNDEKTERKELFTKYEALQQEYHSSALQFEKDKGKRIRYFYLLLGVSVVLTALLIALNRNYIKLT